MSKGKNKKAIISDAFVGILNDATRSALVEDDDIDDLVWIDEQLAIDESKKNEKEK
jgi:hypothetical protein